jgi:hypothetical protein
MTTSNLESEYHERADTVNRDPNTGPRHTSEMTEDDLKQRFAELLAKSDLTQKEAGNRAGGRSQSWAYGHIRGNAGIDIDDAAALAGVFGLRLVVELIPVDQRALVEVLTDADGLPASDRALIAALVRVLDKLEPAERLALEYMARKHAPQQ